jgi:hypothetical protein
LPCVYEDYIDEAKSVLDDRLKEKLRGLLTYEFKRTGAYNYSQDRLKMISRLVQERVQEILN